MASPRSDHLLSPLLWDPKKSPSFSGLNFLWAGGLVRDAVVPSDCAIYFLASEVLTWPLYPSSPAHPSSSVAVDQRDQARDNRFTPHFSVRSRESEQIREVPPPRKPALALNLPDADARIPGSPRLPEALFHSPPRTSRLQTRG